MKKRVFILIIIVGLLAATAVSAEKSGYTFLEKLPSLPSAPEPNDIATYFQWVFSFGISLAGIFAVLMLVIGGIQHITAYGNPAQITSARNTINQALIGLLLAIVAWLLLYTINPAFIKGTFNIRSISKPSETMSTQEALQKVK